MPRHFWISASIAMLVAAFAVFAFALPRLYLLDGASRPSSELPTLQVATYQVPPARAEAIRNSLNSVLFASKDGVQPLGQASLPTAGRLVVSAPPRMHDSIKRAIGALSEGETTAVARKVQASVDIWVVEALATDGPADPRLAVARNELEVARQRFGHRQYRLLERMMIVGDVSGTPTRASGTEIRSADLRLVGREDGVVEANVQVSLAGNRGFESKLSLPEGQWQVVGLLSDSAAPPERLLLMRQLSVQASAVQ